MSRAPMPAAIVEAVDPPPEAVQGRVSPARQRAPGGWARWRLSLRSKVLLATFLVVSILLGLQGALAIQQERHALQDALRQRADLMTTIQADALATALWDYNHVQALAVFDALKLDPDFAAAEVTEVDSNQLYVSGVEGPDDLVVERPIVYFEGTEPRHLGRLTLRLSTARLDDQLRAALFKRAAFFLMLLGVLLGTIYLSVRQITVPLDLMARVLGRLARGRYDTDVPALGRPDEIGDIARAVQVFKDKTIEVERLRAVKERAAAEERLRIKAAVESASDVVAIVDERGRPIFLNEAFRQLIGLDLDKLRRLGGLLRLQPRGPALRELLSSTYGAGAWAGELNIRTMSFGVIPFAVRINVIRDADDGVVGFVVLGTDIRERRANEARIRHIAHHDALTDLPNRILFHDRLEHALALARRQHASGAVLLLDLDRFKEINDVLGHPAGDALLRETGYRLKVAARESDTVARLGGDEFAVVLTGLSRPADAALLARKLIATIARPYQIDGQEVHSGTSVGITLFPSDGADPDRLMRNADMALYRAKHEGRGTLRFFEPGMDADVRARKAVEQDLRRGLIQNEFDLFYQPQVDLASGRVSGVEGLLRWRHPTRGIVAPGEFIGIAEDSGLILPLGEVVIQKACAQAALWARGPLAGLRVALNLSAAQFRSNIVQAIERALDATGVDPCRIEIEITESTLLRDTAWNIAALRRLREIGVRIAMDDFGTGYSSLSHLRRFPFHKIKIDQSFVRTLGSAAGDAAIIRGVIDIGHGLDMAVSAEGVETEQQRMTLTQLGCDEGQGFLFGGPMSAALLERHLAAELQAAG